MEPVQIMEFAREAILLTIKIAAPVMMAGLLVGVVIALVQALTQVQEMTLVFVPKIMAIFLMIFLMLPMMGDALETFTLKIADTIVGGG